MEIPFTLWLVSSAPGMEREAVVVCRCGGLGDVACTLPMCDEVRRCHPGKLLVFITAPVWREVVAMSRCADLVYAQIVDLPVCIPTNVTGLWSGKDSL